jgi:hypothetical protein
MTGAAQLAADGGQSARGDRVGSRRGYSTQHRRHSTADSRLQTQQQESTAALLSQQQTTAPANGIHMMIKYACLPAAAPCMAENDS